MKLEDRIVSLKLSKRLKELGVRQDSLWYWAITSTTNYHLSLYGGNLPECLKNRNDIYSAYLPCELGDIIKDIVYRPWASFHKPVFPMYAGELWVYYDNGKIIVKDKKPADAMAERLIYFVGEGLIKPKEM